MPFSRPTLTDLRAQAMQDVTASDLPNADGMLRRAVLRVLAWVVAGLAYLHYGYLDWIARMAVPFTAAQEFLVAWAALVGIIRKPASLAQGPILFTGTTGSVIPAGTEIVRSDGVQFTTLADGVIDALGSAIVSVIAVQPGAAGQTDAGVQFTIATTIAGVQPGGIANAAFTGGADAEADDALRTRMLQRYAEPPQGGARADYLEWALAVPGVTRAWVFGSTMGPGSVLLYVMLDEAQAIFGGFPQGTDGVAGDETRGVAAMGDQLAVANYIYPREPVTALVYVAAPTAFPINVTITDLDQNTLAVRTAISAALVAVLLQKGEVAGTIYQSDIEEAIASVSGVKHFTLAYPTAPVVMTMGQLPTLGILSIA